MLAVHKVNNAFGFWSQLMPTTLFISPRQEEKQEQQELFKGGMHACCHTKHWSEEVASHSVTHANILFFINAWWNKMQIKKDLCCAPAKGLGHITIKHNQGLKGLGHNIFS